LELKRQELTIVFTVLAVAFLVRFMLFPVLGYRNDLNTFAAWIHAAFEYGVPRFYQTVSWHDYPPLNVYLFWLLGSVAHRFSLFATPAMTYLIKVPPNIFDLATAFVVFLFVRKRFSFRTALASCVLYAFNPATVYNGAVWGQYDGIYTFFLIVALVLVTGRLPEVSAVAYALALLAKPQGIALMPLLLYIAARKHGVKRFISYVATAVATALLVAAPFESRNPVVFLFDVYLTSYKGYAYTSVNAFNFWAFGGFWRADTVTLGPFSLSTIGWLLFSAVAALTLYTLHKHYVFSGETLTLYSAFILLFSFFMLPTRIHERYLYPALSVLVLMLPNAKKMRLMYAVLSFTLFMNQAYVLSYLNADKFIPAGDPVAWTVSLINSAAFLYAIALMWESLRGNPCESLGITAERKTQEET
jgi:Gpi18-like mannosyltransferase